MSLEDFIRNIELGTPSGALVGGNLAKRVMHIQHSIASESGLLAAVDGGSVVGFGDHISPQIKSDVLNSTLFAQLAADAHHDRFTDAPRWYMLYATNLAILGWGVSSFGFVSQTNSSGAFRMDKYVLDIIQSVVGDNKLQSLTDGLEALKQQNANAAAITIFESMSFNGFAGNFQLGEVSVDHDSVSLSLGAFHFRVRDNRSRFLFFEWGSMEVNFWSHAETITFNQNLYDKVRQPVVDKLGSAAIEFIENIELGRPTAKA